MASLSDMIGQSNAVALLVNRAGVVRRTLLAAETTGQAEAAETELTKITAAVGSITAGRPSPNLDLELLDGQAVADLEALIHQLDL